MEKNICYRQRRRKEVVYDDCVHCLRSSDLRGMSRLRDPAEYVSKAKHRWGGHIMRRIDDRWTKRTLEWIPRDAKRA
ncbi:hypothetical protein RB195_022055 [Necator americanus]|uniref:Uncharacterized protein n=1 Tax=Necator americanus TaxID=51031 RepID=A0ABR1EGI3_NECAM